MTQGVEIATAWVRLVPSMDGATGAIAQAIAPGIAQASKTATTGGQSIGANFVGGVKKALIGAAIGAAAIGMVKGLYEIGATFDEVQDTIRIGTGATGDALRGLTDVAVDVGKSIPTSFEDAGQTVADLNTRLGLSGSTLKTVASQYLEAGRMLGQQVDINTTTKAFSAFRIEGDAVSGAMDHLFRVAQATGVGINDLATKTATAAPLVKNIGLDFEETASLVGTLDKAGLDANKMLASLNAGLVNMARSGEQPIDVFPRVVGELEGLIASGDVASAIDLAGGIFGTRGASQFVAAVQSGSLNLSDLVGQVGATGDTILGVSEDTQDFAERWQVVQNNATAALEPLASTVFNVLGDTLTAMMPTLTEFGSWLSENEWVLGVVAGVIGVTLVAAFIAWTASIWAANVALLANPITWIILAIVALIAIVVLLVMNWDEVVAFITDIWSGFVDWLVGGLEGLASWWNDLWSGIFAWAESLWQGYVDWVLGIFRGFLGFMQDTGRNLTDWWDGLWSGLADFVGDAFRNVGNFVIGGLNTVIDLVNGAISGLNTLGKLASDVTGGAVGWNIGLLPKIPQLAAGGIVMPQPGGVLAMLAERNRPEVVLPLDRLYDLVPATRDFGPPLIYNAAENQSLESEEALWEALERREALTWR